jgi:hypothetical protein
MARAVGTNPALGSAGLAPPGALRPRRSVLLGAIAGLIGISCCVYPVALVLLGLSSAVAAVDLGNFLFDEWGWAFRSAGAAFALAALWIQRRLARACPVDARPTFARSALWIAATALVTYAVVYGVTTWLRTLAE